MSYALVVLLQVHYFSVAKGLLDVVYAIDATSPKSNLKEMKSLVRNAVKPLNIKNGDARIGLVSYGKVPIKLVDFANPNKAGISLALDFIEHQNEEKNTVKVLRYVKDNYFTGPSTRNQARRLMVLLTSGDEKPSDILTIDSMLKSLNSSDIGYVIVNIGGSAKNANELTQVGTKYGKVVVGKGNRDIPDALPTVIESGKQRTGKSFAILW